MTAIASVPPCLGRRWLGAGLLGSALLLAGCAVGPVVPVYPGDGAIVAQPYTTYGTYGTYAPYGYSYGVQPVYPAVAPPPVSVWIGGGSTWHSRPGYRPPAPPPHWGDRPGRPGPAPAPALPPARAGTGPRRAGMGQSMALAMPGRHLRGHSRSRAIGPRCRAAGATGVKRSLFDSFQRLPGKG